MVSFRQQNMPATQTCLHTNVTSVISPAELSFKTTDDVEPVSGIAAQERALSALSFGLDIRHSRFHVVVVGPSGSGRTFCARQVAQANCIHIVDAGRHVAFAKPGKAKRTDGADAPAGEGRPFTDALEDLYAKLLEGIRGATEGERWKQARARVQRRVEAEEAKLEEELKTHAQSFGLEVTRAGREFQVSPIETESPSSEALRSVTCGHRCVRGSIGIGSRRRRRRASRGDETIFVRCDQGLFRSRTCAIRDRRPELVAFLADVEALVTRRNSSHRR